MSFDSPPLFVLSAIVYYCVIYYCIAIISVSCSILDICSVSRFDWYRPIFRVKRDSLMNDSIAFVLDVSSITLGFFDIIKIIQRLSLYLVAISRIDDDNWNKFQAFSWIVYEKRERNNMKKEQRKNTPSTIYIARGLIFVSSPFFIVSSHSKLERTVELRRNDSFLGSFRMWASGKAPCCF